jgi:hypothetical protein
MTATEFEKFIKLMMMTTSSQDYEALSAMRKANALLAGMNRNWEEVLRGKVSVKGGEGYQQPFNNFTKHDDAREIDPWFEKLLREVSPSSSFREFVEDVHKYWEQRGYLTEAQYRAIKKAAER